LLTNFDYVTLLNVGTQLVLLFIMIHSLLGKVKVPRTDENYDMESEEGKKVTIASDMNELAYTELILSIDDKTSSGKVAFNLVKGCKNNDYTDGSASMAWE
jgi:hypothetical protein